MENLYKKILEKSKQADNKFKNISNENILKLSLKFPVPTFHPRSQDIKEYPLKVTQLTKEYFDNSPVVFVDKGITPIDFVKKILPSKNIFIEEAREETFKEWNWLNKFLDKNKIRNNHSQEVIAIGGGLTMNVASYIAELLKSKLTLIPTTIVAMADISGGKVRLNMIDKKRSIKHYYKSYYEPNQIIVDTRFLDTLNGYHIATGLGEIIKHGIYQSEALLDFLLSDEFDPFNDKKSLLKAILWTAALKAVCLEIDVEENANGSRKILRGGHELSDKIEEDTNFKVPHGLAVAIGIYRELELSKSDLMPKFKEFTKKFNIPKTVEEFNLIKQT